MTGDEVHRRGDRGLPRRSRRHQAGPRRPALRFRIGGSMRFLSALIGLASSVLAHAAPVTFDVTPTFAAPAGIIDGYRAYRDCDLQAQTAATLIGPAQSGVAFSFQGDSAASYVVCVRAYNTTGEGGFATVGNIAATLNPPGDTSTTYVCQLNPVSGGTCTATP